jgi:hypothetical protein
LRLNLLQVFGGDIMAKGSGGGGRGGVKRQLNSVVKQQRSVSAQIDALRSQRRVTHSSSVSYRAQVAAHNKPIDSKIRKLTKQYRGLVEQGNALFYAARAQR